MSPILTGVIASGISGNLTPPWSPEGAYDALATVTLSTATASVTFSGIPSGYKHLQIRALATSSGSDNGLYMRINGDASNAYKNHWIFGNGSGAAGNADPGGTSLRDNMYVSTNLFSTHFSGTVIDILDYTSSNKVKVIRSFAGNNRNGAGFIWLVSGVWFKSTEITSLTFTSETNLAANSHYALYGVK